MPIGRKSGHDASRLLSSICNLDDVDAAAIAAPDVVRSIKQMQERSVTFLESLAVNHPDETLLIVVHAGVIRGLICHFLDLDYASNLKQHMGHQYIGDFTIEGNSCVRYDELGKPSEFIRAGVIKVPFYRSNKKKKK